MRDDWEEHTQKLLLQYFDRPGLDVAVVGNGPISRADRAAIANSSRVVRFNDVNNFWKGEKTTLRVVRHPSWITLKHTGAPKWHVSPTEALLPRGSEIVTGMYEPQRGHENLLPDDAVIFPSCLCGDSCRQAGTWAGPSTGAVALSVLQEMRNVETINVYGMNWNGDKRAHIDFANKTLVRDCCTKCVIHPAASNSYGAFFFATGAGILTMGGVAAFFLTGGTVTIAAKKLLGHHTEHKTPLLGLKHPPGSA
tara:strand:+ start:493 stop:1248 length:756 start_codon:yes stop_codon:yes gene_type:complete